jgi:hypothetical protein
LRKRKKTCKSWRKFEKKFEKNISSRFFDAESEEEKKIYKSRRGSGDCICVDRSSGEIIELGGVSCIFLHCKNPDGLGFP